MTAQHNTLLTAFSLKAMTLNVLDLEHRVWT